MGPSDDLSTRLKRALRDDVTQLLLLYGLASLLGFLSVLTYFLSPGGEPTRVQLSLLVGSMVIIFYLLLRSSTYD